MQEGGNKLNLTRVPTSVLVSFRLIKKMRLCLHILDLEIDYSIDERNLSKGSERAGRLVVRLFFYKSAYGHGI